MDFELQSSRPIWQQLTEQLSRRIVTGIYPPGSKFPTVRELAADAGVNPNTMQRALAQLESMGLVNTNRTDEFAKELREKYYSDMKELGYTRAQAAEMIAADKEERE